MGRAGFRHIAWLAAALSLVAVGAARADEAAAEATRKHLYEGTLAAGDQALSAMLAANPNNAEARYGLGMVRFVRAVERLSQGLYRFGQHRPRGGGFSMVPVLRLPVPFNPNPQPVTYDAFRQVLVTFGSDVAAAEKTLGEVGPAEVKLPINVMAVRYDADGNGKADDTELLSVVTATFINADRMPGLEAIVGFDRADAYWLQGYCNVLLALTDFLTAHDWREAFEASFHHVFPLPDWPLAKQWVPSRGTGDEYPAIADVISFVHLFNWPVTEPDRMRSARQHLKQVIALSRKNWDAILAETDNDREWVPSPKQVSVLGLTVTDAQAASWRDVLIEAEKVLDGALLIPHWRFNQGLNLRRLFDEPRRFDLVLMITGPGALPYLESGPLTTDQNWRRMMQVFGGNFGAYAVWFN